MVSGKGFCSWPSGTSYLLIFLNAWREDERDIFTVYKFFTQSSFELWFFNGLSSNTFNNVVTTQRDLQDIIPVVFIFCCLVVLFLVVSYWTILLPLSLLWFLGFNKKQYMCEVDEVELTGQMYIWNEHIVQICTYCTIVQDIWMYTVHVQCYV